MKLSKRLLSIVLVLLMAITSVTTSSIITVNAASKSPVFTVNSVTELTYNNAKISARITNPNKTNISKVGFQLGTASNKLTTDKYDNVNKAYNYVDASFLMSKYKVTLNANTTYYYRFYIVTGGKTDYSSVKSFKTKPVSVKNSVFTINNVSGVTYNNAQISARITNPNKTKITKTGFQIGLANNKLTLADKYDNIPSNLQYGSYIDISYQMSKYKVTLKANTTYYYRFYIVTGGKAYYSDVKSFKTKTDTPTISYKSVSGLTYNNATINGTMSNPKNITINKIGFQLGTASNKLTTNKYYNFNNKGTSKELVFKMSSYKVTLNANTTYYYRMYVTSGSNTYYGSVQSFKTPPYAKYTPIKSLSISRIEQSEANSCYLSSVATVYGYMKKGNTYRKAGVDYQQAKDAVYKEVKKYNGNKVSVQNNTLVKCGLTIKNYNLDTIYNSLKAGKPVVVYYNNGNGFGHASIIIGYNGNTSKLEESGFTVMEINRDGNYWANSTTYFNKYSNNPQLGGPTASCYLRLDKWYSYLKNYYKNKFNCNLNTKTLCIPK